MMHMPHIPQNPYPKLFQLGKVLGVGMLGALIIIMAMLPAASADAQMIIDNFSAGNFSCSGGEANGQLFDSGTACTTGGIDNIFSNFICEFERLVSDILGKMYCSVADALLEPLAAFLTLAVATLGVAFLLGLVPFTAKELAIFMFKLALVMAFASNAEGAIGFGYRAVMTFAYEGVALVLEPMMEATGLLAAGENSASDVFSKLDEAFRVMLTGNAESSDSGYSSCQYKMLGLVLGLSAGVPPLFLVLLFVTVKLVVAFVKAIYGYLFAILMIAFLIVLSPIMVPFMLFKSTSNLFEKYIGYFFSYVIQVVVVFAFIGMVVYMNLHTYLSSFLDLIQPIPNDATSQAGSGAWFDLSGCGICEFESTANNGDAGNPDAVFAELQCKEGGEVIGMFEMMTNGDFIKNTSLELLKLAVFAYVIELMIGFVPEIARFLGGQRYAAQIGGSTASAGRSSIDIPGEANLASAGRGLGQGLRSSDPVGGVRQAVTNTLVGDRDSGSRGIIGDMIGNIGRMGSSR